MMVNTWVPTKDQRKAATPKRVRQGRTNGRVVTYTADDLESIQATATSPAKTNMYSHTEECDRSKWLAQEEEARCPGVW